MSAAPFLQLYVGDYLADTLDLTTEQHGAYLLLLMTMWRHDASLPNDPAKLARIARVSARRWHLVWDAIGHYFYEDGHSIRNKRLDREHQKAVSISQKRSASGEAGGRAKALKNKDAALANASVLPKHSQISDIREDIPSEDKSSSGPVAVEGKSAEAELFRFGKSVLGKNAGGVIVNLRKACEYDDAYALQLLQKAAGKHDPMEWINATIRASRDRPYRGVVNMEDAGARAIESKADRAQREWEDRYYATVI